MSYGILRRMGASTPRASAPAPTLDTAIITSTTVQLPVAATRKFASGTASADVPFAVYSSPLFAVA